MADWRALATGWFLGLFHTRLQESSWPSIEPHRDHITAHLKAGVTVATIHQRLAAEHGLDASVASVRRRVWGDPARGGAPRPGHRFA